MSLLLSRFVVVGLHGKFDVDIPIIDNKLILVGVNGLGKTTVVNLLYYLLTTQWGRLFEIEFSEIRIHINGAEIALARSDIEAKLKLTERYEKALSRWTVRSPFPQRLLQRVISHSMYPALILASPSEREKLAPELAMELDIPPRHLLRMIGDIPASMQEDLFSSAKDTPAMMSFLGVLKDAGSHEVIYLPTYRRIEQDIKSIFPALDDDELRRLTSRNEGLSATRTRGHVELVHFGMQDVEKKISEELEAIRERTRSALTNLTGSYLKDIIGNRADAISTENFRELDDAIVQLVLERVDENTLNSKDKAEVRSAIQRVRKADGGECEVRDKYLAYFFSRLLMIYVDLANSESNIRKLVDTCNKYLERKFLQYDDSLYTAGVVDVDGAPLSWRVLSSGEKQVASLFTHLFLSKNTEQTVIIDEPELSLSVPWQKTLLPDIVDSGNCKLLIAVTHSPFIYANKLDPYAVDLSKCISVRRAG